MAQRRIDKNILNLVPIKVGGSDPLDARLVVDAVDDLIKPDTWDGDEVKSVYRGMQVYCIDKKETWMFVGNADAAEKVGVAKTQVTDAANWRKVSDPNFSIDKIEENFNDIKTAVGLSGLTSAQTLGYDSSVLSGSVHNPTKNATDVMNVLKAIDNQLTVGTRTCADVSGATTEANMHKNIIHFDSTDKIEAFADIHYDETSNTLRFINTNGSKEIKLKGINFIDHIEYNSKDETLDIYYQEPGKQTLTKVSIDLKNLIEEYSFKADSVEVKTSTGTVTHTHDASSTSHNVSITAYRSTSGSTEIYGDIDYFDCGSF